MPNNVFPYPGNKARHSDWILEHIPEHTCYVEPFGGAAGVLFNKPKSKVEVYNDVNGDLVQFFKTLRERGDDLQEWLKNVPFSQSVYREWRDEFLGGDRPDDPVKRAGIFFTLRYQSFGGALDNTASWRRPSSDIGEASAFVNKTDALLEFRDRLRGVHIEERSAVDVIERYDSEDTVFYCDPPYIGTEHRYANSDFNHRRLHNRLSECEGSVLLSYDDIPPWFGDGWQVVTKEANFAIDNVDGVKDATEVLLMNFDSDGEPLMSDVGQQGLDAFAD